MKTWAGHNPRDFRECDSVPEVRDEEASEVPKGRQELRLGCLMSSFQD